MDDDPSLRFAAVRLATGPRVNCAEHGGLGGNPIVFLHGWPDSWFSFSRIFSLLPTQVRALAFDQRGFGDSDRPESGYAIQDLAGDVVALLDALEIDRATLVGHSFGSFVARNVAITHPTRVDRLVLIGTGFPPSNSVMRELQHAMRDLPDPIPVDFARDFQASTVYRQLPTEFFERIVAESLKLPPRLWRLTIDRLLEYDDEEALDRIAAPTLLLWGDHDALFSRAEQDRFVAALPHSRLTVYEETGHCPNWERPERVATDISDFQQER